MVNRSATISAFRLLLGVCLILALAPMLRAQRGQEALSQAEIEQLRDTNRLPDERVQAFIKFLDERTETIRNLTSKPRRPGREQDIHDAMEQFVSITDSLEDNLNEYSTRHRDVRKALPKLLRAIDRWSSIIKSPPDDDAYNVSRKLSLESIRDLREDAEHLVEEQRTWFAAHPPQKDAEGNVIEQ
jgi:septal ring factor EnvC (AmiA/AmiB activator)